MTDPIPDDAARSVPEKRRTAYRIPLAVATFTLYMLCAWALVTGSTPVQWIGGIGLILLVIWLFVFKALRRRATDRTPIGHRDVAVRTG